jgi:RimJ/RimL family protein N-acetyltransferase
VIGSGDSKVRLILTEWWSRLRNRAGVSGSGYATEVARGLIAYALSQGGVQLLRAHTWPEANASTKVLTKCGFEFLGEVDDPDDGRVWRWERQPV